MRRRELVLVGSIFALFAVVWTWPLGRDLAGQVPFDPRFSTPETTPTWSTLWTFAWGRRSAMELQSPFFCDLAFWPTGVGLARQDLALPWAWASIPLQQVAGVPLAVNVALLVAFSWAATAAFALARALGASRFGAALAGFAWAFSPWFVQRGLEGLAPFSAPWPPMCALFALRWATASERRRRWVAATLCGLTVGAAFWTSVVAALWIVPFMPAVLAVARRAGQPVRLGLGDTALALAVVAIVVQPVVAAIVEDGGDFERPPAHETVLADFVTPPGLHPLFSTNPTTRLGSARPLAAGGDVRSRNAGRYLGVGLVTLALLGFALRAPARWFLGTIAFGAILTWDPGGVSSAILARLPVTRWVEHPAFWQPVLALPIALAGAFGVDALSRRRRGVVGSAMLVALALAEFWIVAFPTTPYVVPDPVRAIAASSGRGAVLVLPLPAGPDSSDAWQIEHGRPVLFRWLERGAIEGALAWGARAPDLHALVAGGELPTPAGLSFDLETLDVEHVIVREDRIDPRIPPLLDAMERWERGETAAGFAWWYRSGLLLPH